MTQKYATDQYEEAMNYSPKKETIDPKSSYYGAGGVEVIEVMKAKLTPEQFEGYLLGNIIKYSTRANFKGSFDRDIEKVQVYSKQLSDLRVEM